MRSTVTAVVEHSSDVDPAQALGRYVGQSLGGYGRSAVQLREISTVGQVDEPSAAPAEDVAPQTTNEFLAALVAGQQATFELLQNRLG